MKFERNQRYSSIAIYSFLVIAASIIFYLAVSKLEGVMSHLKVLTMIFTPITIGIVMAYLFNFILVFFEQKILFKFKMKNNIKRFTGLVLTYLTVVIMVSLFLKFIFPQLVSSLIGLVNDVPMHVRDIGNIINDLSEKFKFDEEINNIIIEQFNKFMNFIIVFASDLIPKIGNFTRSIISSIWNIVLGLIISVYVLIDKEKFAAQSKKILNAIFPIKGAIKILELTHRANTIFGSFLNGKILDSLIVGILTFVILILFKMPYPILVAFIIGVSNIIPFFGPFIGAIPAFFIILFISPQQGFIFLIIIFVIQQIDGNIIGPKILGDSLGISPFWILFSLLVSGKIFGFIGLIIGVPLFVFLYSIIKDLLEARLKRKGLPVDTSAYENQNYQN